MASEYVLDKPVVVIVGPTASGKSITAIRLAKRLGGEIICADSRTVYRDMDIGTAKPMPDEMEDIPHYGLNLVSPDERFSAADFQTFAQAQIKEIHARGRVPIVVGGTGLYVDGLVYNYQFGQQADSGLRAQLQEMTITQLVDYCKKQQIALPSNFNNKRHLVRAIEMRGVNTSRDRDIPANYIVAGIAVGRSVLRIRIAQRIAQMFQSGVVDETSNLAGVYGWGYESMSGNIYRIVKQLLNKEITVEEAKERAVTADMRLAKRQMTWFRRNKQIEWFGDTDSLMNKCIEFVQTYPR